MQNNVGGYDRIARFVDVFTFGSDRIARVDQQSHEVAQKAVDPLAHQNVADRDAHVIGENRAQVVAIGIAVFPDIRSLGPDRVKRLWRRAEQAFIGTKAGGEGRAKTAFQLFGADKGNVGGQAFDQRGVAWRIHVPQLKRCGHVLQD